MVEQAIVGVIASYSRTVNFHQEWWVRSLCFHGETVFLLQYPLVSFVMRRTVLNYS